jgi:hypothetical protein
LLILALPIVLPVSAPGISILFGVPLMTISAQLMLGYGRAWIPGPLDRARRLRGHGGSALPVLRRFERMVRPRASWLADEWAKIPPGADRLVLATIITLPIPLGHVAPGTAICWLALGLMKHDGVVIFRPDRTQSRARATSMPSGGVFQPGGVRALASSMSRPQSLRHGRCDLGDEIACCTAIVRHDPSPTGRRALQLRPYPRSASVEEGRILPPAHIRAQLRCGLIPAAL